MLPHFGPGRNDILPNRAWLAGSRTGKRSRRCHADFWGQTEPGIQGFYHVPGQILLPTSTLGVADSGFRPGLLFSFPDNTHCPESAARPKNEGWELDFLKSSDGGPSGPLEPWSMPTLPRARDRGRVLTTLECLTQDRQVSWPGSHLSPLTLYNAIIYEAI